MPPAFSQSAWFVIVENLSLEGPPLDGLADGDVDEPVPDEPEDGVDIEPELDPLVPGLLGVLPGPPAPGVPVPVPPAPWAAATAGARQTIPTKNRESIFFI